MAASPDFLLTLIGKRFDVEAEGESTQPAGSLETAGPEEPQRGLSSDEVARGDLETPYMRIHVPRPPSQS